MWLCCRPSIAFPRSCLHFALHCAVIPTWRRLLEAPLTLLKYSCRCLAYLVPFPRLSPPSWTRLPPSRCSHSSAFFCENHVESFVFTSDYGSALTACLLLTGLRRLLYCSHFPPLQTDHSPPISSLFRPTLTTPEQDTHYELRHTQTPRLPSTSLNPSEWVSSTVKRSRPPRNIAPQAPMPPRRPMAPTAPTAALLTRKPQTASYLSTTTTTMK